MEEAEDLPRRNSLLPCFNYLIGPFSFPPLSLSPTTVFNLLGILWGGGADPFFLFFRFNYKQRERLWIHYFPAPPEEAPQAMENGWVWLLCPKCVSRGKFRRQSRKPSRFRRCFIYMWFTEEGKVDPWVAARSEMTKLNDQPSELGA